MLLLGENRIYQDEISRPLKISPRSIRQTFQKFRRVATKLGAARPTKGTDREKRLIQLQQLRDERGSLVDLLRYVNTNFSSSIGRSTIEACNIVLYITPRERRNRLSCCSDHLN